MQTEHLHVGPHILDLPEGPAQPDRLQGPGYPDDHRLLQSVPGEAVKVEDHLAGHAVMQAVIADDREIDISSLKRKFMSCSHCQELSQLSDLASDWLLTLV